MESATTYPSLDERQDSIPAVCTKVFDWVVGEEPADPISSCMRDAKELNELRGRIDRLLDGFCEGSGSIADDLTKSVYELALDKNTQLFPDVESKRHQKARDCYEQGDVVSAIYHYQAALEHLIASGNREIASFREIAAIIHELGKISCDNLLDTDLARTYYLIELRIRTVLLSRTQFKDAVIPETCFYLAEIFRTEKNYKHTIRYYNSAKLVQVKHFDRQAASLLTHKINCGLAQTNVEIAEMEFKSAYDQITQMSFKEASKTISYVEQILKKINAYIKQIKPDEPVSLIINTNYQQLLAEKMRLDCKFKAATQVRQIPPGTAKYVNNNRQAHQTFHAPLSSPPGQYPASGLASTYPGFFPGQQPQQGPAYSFANRVNQELLMRQKLQGSHKW